MAVQNARLWCQPLLLAVIVMVVTVLVQRVTPGGDLSPIAAPDAPGELMALVDATNAVMVRLVGLLE